MKKILCLLFIFILTVALVSCYNGSCDINKSTVPLDTITEADKATPEEKTNLEETTKIQETVKRDVSTEYGKIVLQKDEF